MMELLCAKRGEQGNTANGIGDLNRLPPRNAKRSRHANVAYPEPILKILITYVKGLNRSR